MIDDLLCIQLCNQSLAVNTAVNTFIEVKKLKLSKSKCSHIHIGNPTEICPELRVHSEIMQSWVKKSLHNQTIFYWNLLELLVANVAKCSFAFDSTPNAKWKDTLGVLALFSGGIRLFLTVIWSGISRNQLEAIPTLCYFLLCEQVGYLMSPVATEPSSSSWADFTWQQCHSSSFFLC